ncbi:MAG: carboxypeptidase regulatory-like domain-containing protein [Terracidiphilus sp.]|nr:carboxypeptidase regulatory-like domain-containing protein [Terracidiphilus sp.]MDR3798093.1 carboxypeptidase regulatory-like domain-containing protein [Terracidiphilus sp.]
MRRFVLCFLLAVLAASARAQFDTATVLGTVTDPSGAVVAHSNVVLRNTATAVEQTAASDDRGEFRFVDVTIGTYELKVTVQGFQSAVAKFELTVGAHQRVDVQLKVAAANSTVTTTAEAAQLETDSSEHGQVVAAREIAALPLNGRNYSQLVALSTGVVPSPSNQSDNYGAREGAFNINGLRSVYTNYLLDGADNNFYGTSNQGFSNEVVQLAPDSVAEFSVVTNNESAEYGRAGGATINAVTKFGTNELHGGVWEYLRNTNLDAAGFFKPDVGGKPALHRNQFGGNVGGPIKKDKLFFFIDYEGYRQTSSQTDENILPTCAERGQAGTTSCGAALGYYLIDNTDPAGTANPSGAPYLPVSNPCNYNAGKNPCNTSTLFGLGLGAGGSAYQAAVGGTQYLSGQIPASDVIPFARSTGGGLLSYLPSPTNTNTYNSSSPFNYIVLEPQSWDKDKGDAKIDWTPSEKMRLFFRYSQSRENVVSPGSIPGVAGDNGDGHIYAPIKNILGGATWTISPVSVLEARFGFSTMQAGKKPIQAGGPSMQTLFGIPGLPTDPQYTGGVTYQYFIDGGWTNLGRLWTSPQYQNPSIWDPKANYTRLMRSHSLKAGVEYQMLHVAQQDLHPVMGGNVYTSPAYGAGYGFYNKLYGPLTGPTTSENTRMFDYANFLLGYQAEMGLSSPTVSQLRSWGWAGYVQDDWRATRRLTVNMGLRYEFNTPIYEADNKLANFNPTTQAVVPATSSDRYTIDPNTEDFGPRVGASYEVDSKTVVRGGYGISYSHWNRVGSNYLSMNPPNGVVALQVSVPGTGLYNNVQSGFPTGMVSPTNYNPAFDTLQYMPRNSPDTQVRSWFFGVQRDLTHNWLLDLSYVGNSGLNEIIVNDINQAPAGGVYPLDLAAEAGVATAPVRVPYANFSMIAGILPWATSDYDGLQAKVEKRFSNGLYLLESFTWSKAIDIAAQALDGGGNCDNCGNGIPSVQNIYNVGADRAISAYNHPFVNTTTAVWSLPVGKGQWLLPNADRLLDEFVGGWQATGIVSGRSGNPLDFDYRPGPTSDQSVSPLTPVDGRNAYRPNISGPILASNKSYMQYLNVTSFSTPPSAPTSGTTYNTFGNMPRNAVRGYDYWDVDMGLSKDFAITERSHFQLRAEAFNLFNHTNFGDPNTQVPDTGGQLSSTQSTGSFGKISSALPARVLQVAGKITF